MGAVFAVIAVLLWIAFIIIFDYQIEKSDEEISKMHEANPVRMFRLWYLNSYYAVLDLLTGMVWAEQWASAKIVKIESRIELMNSWDIEAAKDEAQRKIAEEIKEEFKSTALYKLIEEERGKVNE